VRLVVILLGMVVWVVVYNSVALLVFDVAVVFVCFVVTNVFACECFNVFCYAGALWCVVVV